MSRAEVLQKFLDDRRARRVWQLYHADDDIQVSLYSINGRPLMVTEYGTTRGWDIYMPVGNSNRIDATLEAADAYLGEKP